MCRLCGLGRDSRWKPDGGDRAAPQHQVPVIQRNGLPRSGGALRLCEPHHDLAGTGARACDRLDVSTGVAHTGRHLAGGIERIDRDPVCVGGAQFLTEEVLFVADDDGVALRVD